jgi:hypothetical protein
VSLDDKKNLSPWKPKFLKECLSKKEWKKRRKAEFWTEYISKKEYMTRIKT